MKKRKLFFIIFALFIWQSIMFAQSSDREDVVWARMVPSGTITLDGNLNEDAWSNAEEVKVIYGKQGPLPTSAWRPEFQEEVYFDQTNATVKFLVSTDNQLYLAFNIPDSSVGGTKDWARWDGILMSVKNKSSENRPAPADEYFYTWWLEGLPEDMKTPVAGSSPRFIGKWGTWADTTRTPEGKAAWDAVTKVIGISNDDSSPDQGWIVEMRIDLGAQGYDVTVPNGDVVAMNFSIWDCDWVNGTDPSRIASSRTWFQSPWGNANANNVARVFASPDVTTTSTSLPVIEADIVVPNAVNYSAPLIDGKLNEDVWQGAVNFNIEWDNVELRNSYPTVGPLTSGQFQPELGGNPRPPILDPAFTNIKMFFKDHYIYLAADVNDQLIQGSEEYDKIDGVSFIIGDRSSLTGDNQMDFRAFRVSFDASGNSAAYDYLPVITDTGKAEWAVLTKGTSTVNNNSDVDEGYQIEMKLDLTFLGYPADLGDKLLFMGVMLADGDSFEDPLANYGSRTWFFREHGGGPAAAWVVLNQDLLVGVENVNNVYIPKNIEIFGNYPNPFNPSTKLRFAVPEAGNVKIAIYNSIGQLVNSETLSVTTGGIHEYQFNGANISSGVYYYRISLSGSSKNTYDSKVGKMILLK